jgi:hypothetical protein
MAYGRIVVALECRVEVHVSVRVQEEVLRNV